MQFLLFSTFTTFTALIYFLFPGIDPYTFPIGYRINECQADQVCDVKLHLNAMSFLAPFSKDKLLCWPLSFQSTQFVLLATAHWESATGVRFTFPHPVETGLALNMLGDWSIFIHVYYNQIVLYLMSGICIYIHVVLEPVLIVLEISLHRDGVPIFSQVPKTGTAWGLCMSKTGQNLYRSIKPFGSLWCLEATGLWPRASPSQGALQSKGLTA